MNEIPPVPSYFDTNWLGMIRKKLNKFLTTDALPNGYSQFGTFVWNEFPEEIGEVGSKYIVLGWSYTINGTWEECRTLTGH